MQVEDPVLQADVTEAIRQAFFVELAPACPDYPPTQVSLGLAARDSTDATTPGAGGSFSQ